MSVDESGFSADISSFQKDRDTLSRTMFSDCKFTFPDDLGQADILGSTDKCAYVSR